MDISWYGLSCFRIRESGTTIICDPFEKSVGLSAPRIKANIVTVSHDQPGHNNVERIQGDPKVLDGPGEYEVNNIFITGLNTHHRKENGGPPEHNVAFFFDLGGFTVGHLGDLGEVPSQKEIEELNMGEIDVLLVPVGGGATLDPTRAVEVIGMLEPRVVIPMHYRHPGLTAKVADNLLDVEKFLKEFGTAVPDSLDMLKLTKSTLPEETQLVLLNLST
ncbi:MAG: MBL fold metallo-hydrolase [Caldilineaceae bacterium]|nr:MBL fold metallo-hydrolase [Caldilineaceae bacterium]